MAEGMVGGEESWEPVKPFQKLFPAKNSNELCVENWNSQAHST